MEASCNIEDSPQSGIQLEVSNESKSEKNDQSTTTKFHEDHFGGYDETFINPLPNDLKCPVCFLALRQPIQTEECGHRFCESCFKNLQRIEGQLLCPLDRQAIDLDMVFLDKAAKRAILSLPIHCRHYKRNCEWIGDLSSIDDHLKQCAFVDVSCPNNLCQAFISRYDLSEHLELFCEFRIVDCLYCMEKFIYRDIVAHRNKCPSQPIECINKCGEKNILRMMMPQHVENDCAVSVQYCEYLKIGCIFKGTQGQRDNHVVSSANHHLTLAIEKIKKLENKVSFQEEQVRNLATKLDAFQKREDFLETTIRSAERQICSLETKFANIDGKIRFIESRSAKNNYIWCLDNIDSRLYKEKKSAKDQNTCSAPFYSAPFGYKFCMQIYLNGIGDHKGTHISLFLIIMKGEYDNLLEWPLTKKLKVSLLDQSNERDHKVFEIDPNTNNLELFNKPESHNKRLGIAIPHRLLAYPGYLVENKLMIKCEVEP